MARKVVEFTGGKRSAECEEQIEPKRVQAFPKARYCIACQKERDAKAKRIAHSLRPNDIAVYR